ncbi:MAG: cytochrome oxidase assembly protein ShyY1 [Oceanicoccus sp.]|jgi:cytochrome oxidase assembly protein ShyY1
MTESPTRLRFTPNWRASVLAVLLIPLLLWLGFWQLDRAEEKRGLQQQFEQRQQRGPVLLSSLDGNGDLRYQSVELSGEFINDKVLLLDNRIYQGRFGYEIIQPFKLTDKAQLVLVNRGWVVGDKSRRELPNIKPLLGDLTLVAEIYVPHGEPFSLGNDSAIGWPRVLQSLEIAELTAEFELPLFPYTVRLKQESSASFENNWMVVNLKPSKHVGYAVQWFAMSATLLIILLLSNTNLWALLKRK